MPIQRPRFRRIQPQNPAVRGPGGADTIQGMSGTGPDIGPAVPPPPPARTPTPTNAPSAPPRPPKYTGPQANLSAGGSQPGAPPLPPPLSPPPAAPVGLTMASSSANLMQPADEVVGDSSGNGGSGGGGTGGGGNGPIERPDPRDRRRDYTPTPIAGINDDVGFEADMRGDVYTPGGDERLRGAQGATDAAGRRIQSGRTYSDRAGAGYDRFRPIVNGRDRYSAEQDAAVAGLGGPSRTALAQQALADFDKTGEQALAQRFRKVGQTASKFGRIGIGDVNQELGSIQGDFERDRMLRENELARGVAEGDIGDRFRRVDTMSGLRGREAGLDLDRARTALDYGGRDADRDIGQESDQFDAAGRLEDRIFGQGRSNRDEYRGERGYQQGARQQSLDNRIRERQLQEAIRSNDITRAIALMQAGGRVPNLDALLTG